MIDTEPRLLEARRGLSLSYLGKTLLSLFDPIDQAERIARAAGRRDKTLYFCPSPLFGYGLNTLLTLSSTYSAVLCVERDEKLMRVSLSKFDPDLVDAPRCAFVHAVDAAAVCAFVRKKWGPRAFRRIETVRLSGGWTLAEKEYESMFESLRDDIALNWANAMTMVRLGRRYALNAARNLALLPRASMLEAIDYGDENVLVLGAGPSMDALADRIEESPYKNPSQRTFRIICVDTALTALLARGIEPDLVIALEAQHWNLRDFVGAAPAQRPLAVDLSAIPGTAEAAGGSIIFFSTRWTSLRFLDRLERAALLPPELPPLGSVGLTAVAAALRTTTGAVLIAGLDFAYSLDAYHGRSTPSRDDRLRRSNRLSSLIDPLPAFRSRVVPIRTADGALVRSDPALRGYRDLFKREFAPVGRVMDARECGLDLGIPRLGTEEAFDLLTVRLGGSSEKREGVVSPYGDRAAYGDRAFSGESAGFIAGTVKAEAVLAFVNEELGRLNRLRGALSKKGDTAGTDLDRLVDECDYLWAHFPECAGADGARPPLDDLSFLKRVRAEIEPFAKAFTIAHQALVAGDSTPRSS